MKVAIKIAEKARIGHLATLDDHGGSIKPRVRSLELWFADESGFYFQTTDLKALDGQIKKNPQVEVLFYLPNQENPVDFKMLRVEGQVEFLEGQDWENRVYQARPWLKDIAAEMESHGVEGKLTMFRLAHGEARIFDMSYNCRESQIPVIEF